MGGGGLFGLFGSNTQSMPQAPVVESAPVRETESEPAAKSARDAERRKLRARAGGINGTLLSNQLGESGVLGRSGW